MCKCAYELFVWGCVCVKFMYVILCIHAHVCVCVCAFACVLECVHGWIGACLCVCACVCVCAHTCACVCVAWTLPVVNHSLDRFEVLSGLGYIFEESHVHCDFSMLSVFVCMLFVLIWLLCCCCFPLCLSIWLNICQMNMFAFNTCAQLDEFPNIDV